MTNRLIARRDEHGEIDDVVIDAPRLFRAERMAEGHWWVALSLDDGSRVVMGFTSATPMAAYLEHEPAEDPS